jgi:precorrin-8X/cobalt-precorrin-8 methylmutase
VGQDPFPPISRLPHRPADDPVVLLLGHGTRDPAGVRELRQVAGALGRTVPYPVDLGVIEYPTADVPAFADVADAWVARGARRLVIVPLLLFPAGHLRDDVPAQVRRLRQRLPADRVVVTPPLGSHPSLLDLTEERLMAAGWSAEDDARADAMILLVGRGSTVAAANAELFRLARLLSERRGGTPVEGAFVSLTDPDVAAGLRRCLALGARRLVVLPYLLCAGRLVTRIAETVRSLQPANPALDVTVAPHLGPDSRLVAAIDDLVTASLGPPDASVSLPAVVSTPGPPALVAPGEPADSGAAPRFDHSTLVARYALPPEAIERRSLASLDSVLRQRPDLDPAAQAVVRRMIYAAGDPALVNLIQVHPNLVRAAVAALRRAAPVVVDVHMVAAGLDRARLARLGLAVHCAIDGAAVTARARQSGLPRAVEAMRALAPILDGSVVAIGNAPTALLALLDLIDSGQAPPAAILGLPVGFVAAAEAKRELARRAVPFLTLNGTRGGSPLAASALNALLRLAEPAVPPAPSLNGELVAVAPERPR